MSTRVVKRTTKKAPKRTIARIGGRSRLESASKAYWPTPLRLKMFSIKIAPPSRAPKSRPKRVTIGISELRITWRLITRRSPRPLARAERNVAARGEDFGLVSEVVEEDRGEPEDRHRDPGDGDRGQCLVEPATRPHRREVAEE